MQLNYELRHKSGKGLWIRISGDSISGNDEVLWIVVDITKRVMAEKKLKQSRLKGQTAKFNAQPRDRGAVKAHKAPRRAAAVSIKTRSDGRNFKYDSASMEAAVIRYLGYGFVSKH